MVIGVFETRGRGDCNGSQTVRLSLIFENYLLFLLNFSISCFSFFVENLFTRLGLEISGIMVIYCY